MKIQQFMKLSFFSAVMICGFSITSNNSFAANNAKTFFSKEASSRDGSMFPGGKCTTCNPDDKDGSIFPGGSCVNCPTTCCNKAPKKKKPNVVNYEVAYDDELYKTVHRDCKNFAPINLEYVDFRIKKGKEYEPYSTKLGNYRFRIFGCRRFEKEAILNQGRTMQKDMKFIDIFNNMVGGCYPIVKMPSDLCLETSPSPMPEYILTAEITDYFMNLCDGYNWEKGTKEDQRTGSSEMTVTWRIMDITKTNTLWKGTSTGYGEVTDGEYNGEIELLESAFADAVSNLRNLPGFEKQLATRVNKNELEAQRMALIEVERVSNPVKCQFETEIEKQTALVSDTLCPECNLCTLTPGALDANGNPIPLCGQQQPGQIGQQQQGLFGQQQIVQNIPLCQLPNGQIAQYQEGQLVTQLPTEQIITEEVLVLPPDEMIPCEPDIIEDSGVVINGGIVTTLPPVGTEILSMPPEDGTIEEDSGIIVAGTNVTEDGGVISIADIGEPQPQLEIEESSGIVESGFGQTDNVTIVDDTWIDIDSEQREAAEHGYFESENSLCIIDREPYDKMTPENLYKVRASIVSITNNKGQKGAGLIVSNQFVLTSADLITKENNRYDLETINGGKLKASAFRINPSKNTALLILDEKTKYTPLSLNLDLPDVGKGGFMALGLLDIDGGFENGEGYLDDNGTVSGYRYSEDKGAEIIIDTFVQTVTVGGALIDKNGTINGLAHSGKKTNEDPDLFIPTETALRSLGLSICGKPFQEKSPWQKYKPLTEAIKNNSGPKDPEVMNAKERK